MVCSVYVGKVAAEALAARRHILEGPWETAAWFVIRLNGAYDPDVFGFASDRDGSSTCWPMHVCPNAYLRFELIHLFRVMVDTKRTSRSQALEAVISACSILNMDYLIELNEYDYNGFFNIDKTTLTDILEMFVLTDNKLGDCPFDIKLADRLKKDLSSRLWQVAYNHSIQSISYTEPVELRSITALLNITRQFSQEGLHLFKDCGLGLGPDLDFNAIGVEEYSRTLYTLMSNFKKTLQISSGGTTTVCGL